MNRITFWEGHCGRHDVLLVNGIAHNNNYCGDVIVYSAFFSVASLYNIASHDMT